MAAIAGSHSDDVVVAEFSVTEPISPDDLDRALDEAGDVRLVAVVHSESSSGLLNAVRELAEICRQHGVLLVVDAVSSAGGVELKDGRMGNRSLCLSVTEVSRRVPGLGIVAVGTRAWGEIQSIPARGWYLNLHVWKRFRRRRSIATRVREQLSTLGFMPIFSEAMASSTVLGIRGQKNCSADEVVDRLRTEHHILIAGGMGVFAGQVFRIGNMGPQATDDQMDILLDAISCLAHGSNERG